MAQEIGGVVINTIGSGAFEFILAITTRKQTNSQGPRATCREHVPNAVSYDNRALQLHSQLSCRRHKQVGIWFRVLHLISRDDHYVRADTEKLKCRAGILQSATRRDGPGDTCFGEVRQKLAGARK